MSGSQGFGMAPAPGLTPQQIMLALQQLKMAQGNPAGGQQPQMPPAQPGALPGATGSPFMVQSGAAMGTQPGGVRAVPQGQPMQQPPQQPQQGAMPPGAAAAPGMAGAMPGAAGAISPQVLALIQRMMQGQNGGGMMQGAPQAS